MSCHEPQAKRKEFDPYFGNGHGEPPDQNLWDVRGLLALQWGWGGGGGIVPSGRLLRQVRAQVGGLVPFAKP